MKIDAREEMRARRREGLRATVAVLTGTDPELWRPCGLFELDEGLETSFVLGHWDLNPTDRSTVKRPLLTQSPREAWELLSVHDRIPAEWLDHPRRRFVCCPERRNRCPVCLMNFALAAADKRDPSGFLGDRRMLTTPASMGACIQWSLDVTGMLGAESEARQLLQVPEHTSVIWTMRLSREGRPDDGNQGLLLQSGYLAAEITAGAIVLEAPAYRLG